MNTILLHLIVGYWENWNCVRDKVWKQLVLQ